MGLEKEKLHGSLIMDQDEFHRCTEPVLSGRRAPHADAPGARDARGINAHLKVVFEDVIAEPDSSHSFDRVWVWSHAGFELAKFLFYRLLTALLAVPVAFLLGLLVALLSLVHIWLVMPCVHTVLMLLPSVKIVWRSLTDTFVSPLFTSAGKILSSIRATAVED
ncbi:caveolin-2 [Eucyclogobius newberryi]|uniref:caveolin-2 n=1 Tax=Eucyclogobius newberryi TaxID=166745 RepID=UPI003B594CEF